jgi:hypothetical protein
VRCFDWPRRLGRIEPPRAPITTRANLQIRELQPKDIVAPGFFQRRMLHVCLLIVGRYPRIAVFHVFIVGQAFGTGKPAFSAGAPFVPKLTLFETPFADRRVLLAENRACLVGDNRNHDASRRAVVICK